MGIEITSSLSLKSSVHVWTSTPSITHPPGIEAVCWAIVYTDEEMNGFFPEETNKERRKKRRRTKIIHQTVGAGPFIRTESSHATGN